MRISNVFSGRPAYFDRNPTTSGTVGNNQIAIAPHGLVTRATYTVPAGRKAFCRSWYGYVRVVTVAGTPVQRQQIIQAKAISIIVQSVWSNTANDNLQQSGTAEALLSAGDTAVVADSDSSTGGTVDYISNLFITEFDA